ncbi:MAG: DUF6456 domain-containing protein [Parvibaculum sp.]|uniref:DUF6456 domain-containing protein n=1 Tax=Parvibaculum sp. TaxID=2024848 RepID=UPI0025E244FD|nr:DUF6456 domain-containing protein [Parvibaculum sp.]MCE9649582.1 DUF6456 domain-containing protein [Parvibaculum sp.]
MSIRENLWAIFERRDLVRASDGVPGEMTWLPSEAGRAYWRRLEANADPFRAQHQLHTRRTVSFEGATIVADVNEAETSLGWLRRRKGADGKPLVSETQVEAGERLRRDFTMAQMNPRVTADWSMALGPNGKGRRPRDPADVADRALAARERLAQAFDAVGSGLAGVLVEVCCNQRGLEEIERGFGWPQRAGKVVLQIALNRLADHYGMEERSKR